MNCDRIEELLPGYADGDISDDDRRHVDTHVGGCESCRESLAFFARLEQNLIERRTLRPSPAYAADRVVWRLGLKKRHGWVGVFYSVPGAIAAGVMAFAVLWLALSRVTQGVSGGFGDKLATGFEMVIERWLRGVDAIAAASELTLPIVTFGLTALILLAGSWMVLRYVRE